MFILNTRKRKKGKITVRMYEKVIKRILFSIYIKNFSRYYDIPKKIIPVCLYITYIHSLNKILSFGLTMLPLKAKNI